MEESPIFLSPESLRSRRPASNVEHWAQHELGLDIYRPLRGCDVDRANRAVSQSVAYITSSSTSEGDVQSVDINVSSQGKNRL